MRIFKNGISRKYNWRNNQVTFLNQNIHPTYVQVNRMFHLFLQFTFQLSSSYILEGRKGRGILKYDIFLKNLIWTSVKAVLILFPQTWQQTMKNEAQQYSDGGIQLQTLPILL